MRFFSFHCFKDCILNQKTLPLIEDKTVAGDKFLVILKNSNNPDPVYGRTGSANMGSVGNHFAVSYPWHGYFYFEFIYSRDPSLSDIFFFMASCLLAVVLLFSCCRQQGYSNKAAIQQEAPKNLTLLSSPFPAP
jgi:hypothetical protein